MVLQFDTVEQDLPSDFSPAAKVNTEPVFSGQSVAELVSTATRCFDAAHCTHDVVISNLKPNTKYYYTCGSDKYGYQYKQSMSDHQAYSFVTTPQVGSPETRVAILGDLGGILQDESDDPLAFMTKDSFTKFLVQKSLSVHAFWHLGDIAYFDQMKGAEFYLTWHNWFRVTKPAMQNAPYMVLPGNHEYGTSRQPGFDPSYMINFVTYNRLFRMPSHNGTLASHNMWHSFKIGPVHYISLSSETDYPNAPFSAQKYGDQVAWLKTELSRVDRKLTPWVVVGLHRPIYSSQNIFCDATGKPIRDALALQQAFEQLLLQAKVDLVIAAHVHSYERTYPVFNATNIERLNDVSQIYEPKYPIYVINGGAGNLEGLTPPATMQKIPWSVMWYGVSPSWGYLETTRDDVKKVHQLRWTAIRSDDLATIDTFTIYKKF